MKHVHAAIVSGVFLFVGLDSCRASQAPQKKPLPEPAKLAKAEAFVRELFAADYAKKRPVDMRALAIKLLKEGTATKDDDAGCFALLREAVNLSASAGDARMAMAGVDALGSRFVIDVLAMKEKALAAVAKTASTRTANKAVAATCYAVIGVAVGADEYDLALRIGSLGENAARLASEPTLTNRLKSRLVAVREIQKEFARLKPQFALLQLTPGDPDASADVGRFLCFIKGDWDKGLPILALGSNLELKALAKRDLGKPSESTEQVEVGDAWWERAEKESGVAKTNLRRQAYLWYRQAIPTVTGLTQAKLEQRLKLVIDIDPEVLVPDTVGEIRRFTGHVGAVTGVALKGARAISSSHDKTVRLWDTETGRELRRLDGHTDAVFGVAFSPDGRQVLSSGSDGTPILWHLDSGRIAQRLTGHKGFVWGSAFSPKGLYAISGGHDATVRLWELKTGREIAPAGRAPNEVYCVVMSSDLRLIVAGGKDRLVNVFDTTSRRLVRQLKGHDGEIWGLALSADGNYVLSSSNDGTARLWNLRTGNELRRFTGQTGAVYSVAFSPDGKRALTGSGGEFDAQKGWLTGIDNSVCLWDTESGDLLYRLEGHTDRVWAVTFSADGRRALSGSWDGSLRLWGLPN